MLVAAATGSGKTLAAFLAALDQLVKDGLAGGLPDETRVLYISPLKALSNDIHRNLLAPIEGIRCELAQRGLADVELRAAVRTGDTTQAERAGMRRRPPHILVTTPESLYVLLGSPSGRTALATCRSVIVDEIHALAGNKRGAHLALSLERLGALCRPGITRIGLSATQRPLADVAAFLVGIGAGVGGGGGGGRPAAGCLIVDCGHGRRRDLALEIPTAPLSAVMSGEEWERVYDRLAELVRAHRSTLIFVNTRRLAERVSRHLSQRIGAENVTAHHGSLAKERRLAAEQRLKAGALKALVATASLELGLDIGDVDLVCQIGSTRSINTLLQRVGRAGHAVGGLSKGRVFPLSRDELVECTALLDAVRRGELDRLQIPSNALDVLAQHIAAEVAAREWREEELFALVRAAYPYRDLPREDFDACVWMLAQGFSTRHGRRGALLHHDAVNGLLRAARGARLTAITSGGAIPDNADYRVMLEPEGVAVGSVNEDFAVESLQGDVFQLGNTSYRILRVERGTVRVEDARGQAPSIPFWLGEAPGRTDAASAAVSRLRTTVAARLATGGVTAAAQWLVSEVGLAAPQAAELVGYLAAGRAALGTLPTLDTLVFERFFDEAGGMQLVIHSSYGSRVNRAWGLALRKRFCRNFNFEVQAAATEDHVVLSLTQAHSFELEAAARYLHSNTVRDVLVQALCAAPMFQVRWRWTAGISLALPRFRGGRKVAPQLARMNAEDMLAAIFPDQVACAENLQGDIEVPDHPLVKQTLRDCLQEAMDIDALEELLRAVERGAVRIVARDLTQPSPLALEALTARPYAYLDDAPLEERRTQAVMARRWLDTAAAADLGRLDGDVIARVRAEAWPDAVTADELCDALGWLTYLTEDEVQHAAGWPALLSQLAAQRRVVRIVAAGQGTFWVAVERRGLFEPRVPASPAALEDIVRGRLEGLGPVTAGILARSLGVAVTQIAVALAALQADGSVLCGRFTPAADEEEWCDRRLLARIHRGTVKHLRAQIEPVQARDFLRSLFELQGVVPGERRQGSDAVAAVLAQLEGFEAPAGAWEGDILPARIVHYEPDWLDEHCRAGRYVWARLTARGGTGTHGAAPIRSTPIVLLGRRHVGAWSALAHAHDPAQLGAKAAAVFEHLRAHGASFFDDIVDGVRLLPVEVELSLAELAAFGLVNSDSFGGLRALLAPGNHRGRSALRRRRRLALFGMADAGRWALRRLSAEGLPVDDEGMEHIVRTLLKRWGVIFWRLLAREADWLPPWRDIQRCCRRLEARGELRGGRFVAGFSGEQYASPEAVGHLRAVRRRPHEQRYVTVSGADPLNLAGILTPGARLPSVMGNRLVYRDGLPVATVTAGKVAFLEALDPAEQLRVRRALRQAYDFDAEAAAGAAGRAVPPRAV